MTQDTPTPADTDHDHDIPPDAIERALALTGQDGPGAKPTWDEQIAQGV